MTTGEDLYNIGEEIANEWLQYLVNELDTYRLDFGLTRDLIEVYNDGYYVQKRDVLLDPVKFEIEIDIWAQKLPEDIVKEDESVLHKFLKSRANDFIINSNGPIKDYIVTLGKDTRCMFFLGDQHDIILFELNLLFREK